MTRTVGKLLAGTLAVFVLTTAVALAAMSTGYNPQDPNDPLIRCLNICASTFPNSPATNEDCQRRCNDTWPSLHSVPMGLSPVPHTPRFGSGPISAPTTGKARNFAPPVLMQVHPGHLK
jgi:hypothetical protein